VTDGTFTWEPSLGMEPAVARQWEAFYRALWRGDGKAGKYEPVSPQLYRDLYVAQHGCCYICRKAKGKNPDDPKGRGGRRLAVDHNHTTGRVRGLLCSGGDRTCNRIIGWLSPEALRRAVTYVETEPAQGVIQARQEMLGISAVTGWPFPDRDGFLKSILGLK
jgi:hypothetical protein